MKKLSLALSVLLFVLTACSPNVELAKEMPNPGWTGIDTQNVEMAFIRDYTPITLLLDTNGQYSKFQVARVNVLDDEVVVTKATNLKVQTEKGTSVDFDNVRLKAGTYIFSRIDRTKPFGFRIDKLLNGNAVWVYIELAKAK